VTLVEDIVVRNLGRVEYVPIWQAMREFTRGRHDSTPDELWLVEHAPVYTVGQGASIPPLVSAIPVVRTDRGGDITYHGPGQVVLYSLIDLARRSIKVKRFVWLLEQAVIELIGRRAERVRSASPARRACTWMGRRSLRSVFESCAAGLIMGSRST
jgi:lipoyl(octanoyl) transferase